MMYVNLLSYSVFRDYVMCANLSCSHLFTVDCIEVLQQEETAKQQHHQIYRIVQTERGETFSGVRDDGGHPKRILNGAEGLYPCQCIL